MTDIVERVLAGCSNPMCEVCTALKQQADTITTLRAEVAALLEGLETLLHASTTFAAAIRQTTGTAYPWHAMDTAEPIARALLETNHAVK